MAFIKLTKGLFAEVDDDLFEELNKYKWHASGLRGKERPARRLAKHEPGDIRIIYMYHQILQLREWERAGLHVDHEDRNPLNNKRKNLHVKTPSQNQMNSARVDNAKGISYDKTFNRYKAYVGSGNLRVNVGTFKTYEEAQTARNKFLS